MAFFQNLSQKISRKPPQSISGIDPAIRSQQPVVLKSSSPPLKAPASRPQQTHITPTYPHNQALPVATRRGIRSKIIWAALLLSGIFSLVVWVANLPYPMIRRPVARTAPILLLPSYMSMDSHYRQAITSAEQANQLVNNATSPADLDLGEQKVKEAQKHLNALPVWSLDDWPEYTSWLGWRFSIYNFQTTRAKVGQMEAKVFQEKNAQTLLIQDENALNTAKQQYQQASTATDKQAAIAAWQSAIDQLEQIPSPTLAGRTAHEKLDASKRDFKEIVGLAAGNERISELIEAARRFSWEAAKTGQNPPHTVVEWQQIEHLWQQAINRLGEVPSQDLVGYAEAQKLLATYETALGEVKIRQQAEQASVSNLEQAQSQINYLLANTSTNVKAMDRNRTISQLQSIVNQLEKVQNGTTAYLKAQELLLSANNKLKQLQPQ